LKTTKTYKITELYAREIIHIHIRFTLLLLEESEITLSKHTLV